MKSQGIANLKDFPAHSKFGPSSLDRIAACPGSVRESEGKPNFESEYAKEGSAAHTLCEEWLKGKLPPDNTDPETIDACRMYVEHLQDRWKSFKKNENSKWFIEKRFSLTHIHPEMFGTADSVMYDGDNKILYVDDFKFGRGIPVDPDANPQLLCYGLGALHEIKMPVTDVVLTIIQPRYSSDVHEAIKSARIDAVDMFDFEDDLKGIIARACEKDAPLVSGPHCQFCKARPSCPLLRKEAEVAVMEAFSPEKLPELLPTQISELLPKLDAIEFWCKGVREFAYNEAKQGRCPPGYKLVAKRATRKWIDIEDASRQVEKHFHDSTSRECFDPPTLKSPAQVEKILGKNNKEFVANLCVAVSSGDTLVPETDKRQSTDMTKAASMFEALESAHELE